jgi:multicomponent K+:H+ antiporter subunit A
VLRHLKAQRIFDRLIVSLSWRLAKSGAQLLSTRRLQPQLRLLVAVALVAALWPLYRRGLQAGDVAPAAIDPALALVWLVGIACALGAAYQAKFHRLVALILSGGAGLATCITFVWLSAPDLALTQLLVEIVTMVLLLLGLRWLPKRLEILWPGKVPAAVRLRRLRDLAMAVAVGAGMATVAYAVMTRPSPDGISRYFVERAYTEGGGTNIVNVILVDFRGFDTVGEITVLAIVALTVYALMRRFRPAPDSLEVPEQQRTRRSTDGEAGAGQQGDALTHAFLVPALLMRLLFPVIGTTAVYLFMRGHDLPGGGFVAGLTMSVAFILQYMAGGTRWVEARLTILPVIWMGLGLAFALAIGVSAWLFGYPFLTSAFTYADLPVIGRVPLATALIFDLGVFTLVVGATVLILIALAHQSIRSHRAVRAEAVTPEAATVA